MPRKDIIGTKIGLWTVLDKASAAKNKGRSARYLCQCDCGRRRIVYANNLLQGKSLSCGCSKARNLVGKKFGKLTVLGSVPATERRDGWWSKKVLWHCVCECGKEVTVPAESLTRGHTRSCGCGLHRKGIKQMCKAEPARRIHRIWTGMKSRCYNPNATGFANYGGRGIEICDLWRNDFLLFYKWAINSGYADGLTIDRINNDGNYEPMNCRWATKAEQNRNRRTVKKGGVVNA